MVANTVIFDIDGTLADLTHRLHHIKDSGKDYDAFFAKCVDDKPIEPICRLLRILKQHLLVILVSGRSDAVRKETIAWLNKHQLAYDELHMRKAGDLRKDHIVKAEILEQIQRVHTILFVVDDRTSVVNMWRSKGLTCLQCDQWDEEQGRLLPVRQGALTLMVGPSRAGKSSWLRKWASEMGRGHQIITSDGLRQELCGDWRDQSKNDEVFAALHELVSTRLRHGLDTVVDATNIRRKDRLTLVELAKGGPVRYFIIDRPLEEKLRDRGDIPEAVVIKHDNTFKSQIKDILAGDNMKNVTVLDLRKE